ncbi:5' nucleotidase [Teratosphaeria destructans]|uniref:5' nucleotidase n=1 Tax=Teratosphaeria destructans TaxID=418781 RepID=A0A9W7SZT0_9PEZI|nr:5' nucleotidase [Teratosphaeria destructans]
MFARVPLLLAFLRISWAEQPSAPSPISAPLRELPWVKGGLNFLHTTDTHGWHAGHLQEPSFSADWGDYVSFTHHLRQRADDDGSDLLVIDTGDRVEGNGLYDASNPKGKYTFDFFKQQHIDVITQGNHELYVKNTSKNEYDEVVPDFKDSYISSNVDIYVEGKQQPLAPRFRKFTTKNTGVRVLAFGFLFNFNGNANNTVVQPVQEAIKEQWFQDAIREKDVDLFLVAGHVPLRDSPEFDLIYKAIRKAKWDTPIVFFGGHTHIRDYRVWERKAQGIESGRYMETIGFMSIDGVKAGGKKDDVTVEASPKYSRLYIDNNRYSLQHHSGTNDTTFDTDLGLNVSKLIGKDRRKLDLDYAYGCAPQTYWLSRVPYPSNDSLLSWFNDHVLPDAYQKSKTPTIALFNSGALRFDIFKGPFTIDSTFLVSPFTSGMKVIKNVPYGSASQVLQILNNEGPITLHDMATASGMGAHALDKLVPALPPVSLRDLQDDPSQHPAMAVQQQQILIVSEEAGDKPTTPGYTTSDDLGKDGDDTIHSPIQFYNVPNCVGANVNFDPTDGSEKPETVDLAYNEFIEDWVILALQYLGEKYEKGKDTSYQFDGKSVTELISGWVHDNWPCEKSA